MLLIIHNLPVNITYSEIKSLIQSKCGLSEVILDNLSKEGRNKKVTVGLADDGDAAILVRKINGLFVNGQQLYVEDVRQKKASEQPYRSTKELIQESQQSMVRGHDNFQPLQRNFDNVQTSQNTQVFPGNVANMGFQGMQQQNQMQVMPAMDPMSMMMNYNLAMSSMYMPTMAPSETNLMGYGGQQQIQPLMPQVPEVGAQLDRPFGFGTEMTLQNNQDWSFNRNSFDNRQRQSFPDEQDSSPSKSIQKYNNFHRSSRWDNAKPEARGSRQRSRSPQRGRWNTRDDNEDMKFDRSGVDDQPTQFGHQQTGVTDFNNMGTANQFSNVFGSHVTESPDRPRWHRTDEQPEFKRDNSWQTPERKYHPGNDSRPRGDFNFKQESPVGSQQQSWPTENWRDESRIRPKRFADRWANDEPEAKRLATSKLYRETHDKKVDFGNQQFKGPRPRAPGHFNQESNQPKWYNKQAEKPYQSKWAHPSNVPKDFVSYNLTVTSKKGRRTAVVALNNIFKQATSIVDMKKPPFLNKAVDISNALKPRIGSRISSVLPNDSELTPYEIVKIYREKYKFFQDINLFRIVLQQGHFPAEMIQAVKDKYKEFVIKKQNPIVKAPVAASDLKVAQPKSTKLLEEKPARKFFAEMKKIQRKELNEENIYMLPDQMQKALDKEVDALVDLFMGECVPESDDPVEKHACVEISDVASDEFRKLVRLKLTKRLLNITTTLVMKIYCEGMMPSMTSLELFLKDYNVKAIKKSDRVKNIVLIHVGSFDGFDKLKDLGSATIDGVFVTFKEIPNLDLNKKVDKYQTLELRRKFIDSQVDQSDENILEPKPVKQEKLAEITQSDDTNNKDLQKDNVEGQIANKDGEDSNQNNDVANGNMKDDESQSEKMENEGDIDDWGEGGEPWNADDENDSELWNADNENDTTETQNQADIPEDFDDVDENDLEDY